MRIALNRAPQDRLNAGVSPGAEPAGLALRQGAVRRGLFSNMTLVVIPAGRVAAPLLPLLVMKAARRCRLAA